jgi:hypothetical protein
MLQVRVNLLWSFWRWWKREVIRRGIIPELLSLRFPYIVKVLPEPVCP